MKKISISPAEWEVMQILWDGSPLEIGDIQAKLSSDRNRSHQIIRTMLLRLEKKGAVLIDKTNTRFQYAPLCTREQCIEAETKHFLSRIFEGSASGFVLSLAQSGQLTKKERAEILQIIESMEDEP